MNGYRELKGHGWNVGRLRGEAGNIWLEPIKKSIVLLNLCDSSYLLYNHIASEYIRKRCDTAE